MIKPQTLKGFRDFLPKNSTLRDFVISKLKDTFESSGFDPLETPALEYESILLGKYGKEGDKLMYRFKDHGDRNVALRYDQTVPLSRVVAQYSNDLPFPFKRYQIQPVWRADNTQKGRFREFLQCDADIVGTTSLLADAEIIRLASNCLDRLKLKNYSICINDREILQDYSKDIITTIDKLDKISVDGVVSELVNRNLVKTEVEAKQLISGLHEKKMTERLEQLWTYLQKFGLDKNHLVFQPTLARGLDYYTSTIFEIKIAGYSAGSVCGGGRYDDLIGMFTETKIPAVGFAFGFDRLIEALTEQKLLPILETNSTALVIPFSNTELDACIEIMKQLQTAGINAELYLEPDVKLDKKLKYADKKGVPYVVIIGPDEVIQKTATVKNLKTKQQETLPVAKLPHAIIQS